MNTRRHRSRPRLETLEGREVPATFLVTTTATTGPGSLGAAIDQANAAPDPDTITFAVTGQIAGPSGGGLVYPSGFVISSEVTIAGPGADLLSITGPGGLTFDVLAGARLRLSGVTIRDVTTEAFDGAISNAGTLTLDRVLVTNITGFGMAGGVQSSGTLTVTNSVFRDNTVVYYPYRNIIPGTQRPEGGGGITMRGGTVTVTDTLFERNSAFWAGGAVNAIGGGVLTIDRCAFVGNSAGTSLVPASDPSAYAAGRLGGGAVYASGCAVVMTNSTVSGNSSGVAGGGILLVNGATATLTNVTVAANSAQTFGGGIGLSAAPAPVLRNTIVATNILSQAGSPNVPDDYTGTLGAGSTNSLIGANPSGPVGDGESGTRVGTRSAPIDPRLAPLAFNGGPTPTMLPQPGSPALDAGSAAAAAGLATDQRGGGFVRVAFGVVDIGAVEVQPAPPPAAGPGAALIGGPADGTAAVLNQTGGAFYAAGSASMLPGFAGVVRTACADVTGDGVPDYVGGAGPGGGPRVVVLDGATGARLQDFFAFEPSFTGGVFVAAADLDGDGRAEVIVSPDQGGGPRVRVFAGGDPGRVLLDFFGIDDAGFRGGCRAAAGDVNGDGAPDLAVAAGYLGGPRIALFDGRTLFAGLPIRLVGDFFAFPGEDAVRLRNGAYVAVGDVDGDGKADLAFGGGPGGAPRVYLLSGALVAAGDLTTAYAFPVANFFVAGNSTDRGGVRLALKNTDGDARADLLAGSGEGAVARVRSYLGKNFTTSVEPTVYQDLAMFGDVVLAGGVFVG